MPTILGRVVWLLVLLSSPVFATTYYVAANGLDTNNGTTTSTPWLHAPGMPNCASVCAGVTPGAGDKVIFRGGDTWHFVDSAQASYTGGTWSPVGNGTSTSCNLNAAAGAIIKTTCLYYGTDHTFFAGGSYARPIFTLDNAANTAEVASCTHDNGTFHAITATGKSYFIFDDFEIKGWCFSATVTADVLDLSGTMVEGSNLYFHGWTATTGTIDDSYHMMAGNQARGQYMLCDHIVIDGADSSLGTSTSPYAATGFAIFNTCSEIAFNYISRVSNVMIATPTSVHDNTVQYTFNACCGSHGNLFEWNNNAPAGCVYMYNNVTRYSNQGNGNDFNASNSDCGYQFNNISYFYRMVTSTGANGSDGTNCYNYDPLTSPPTFYDFNNTIDFPCSKTGASTNHATLIVSNEHYIGYSTGVPCAGACTSAIGAIYSGNLTTTNNGSHIFQTEAVANGQGYVLGNNYAPTSGSNATVGAGTNNTSICTSMDLSTATAACKLSTSGGVTEVSGEGGFIIGGTVTTPQLRPSSGAWDAGAYQFPSSGVGVPQLPTTWVNNQEFFSAVTSPAFTINFPATSTGGTWVGGGPYTSCAANSATCQASLQQAINDAEAYRTTHLTSSFKIAIPPALYSGANGISLPQTANDTSGQFIVLTSTIPLPVNQTVCSHGIQDNVALSTQPGIRNLGCTGTNMYYQLGTSINTISAGSFTLANGNATNTAAYNDVASMYTIECTVANCNSMSTATWDANLVGPHHFAILNAEIRPKAGNTSTAAPFAVGQNTETQTSEIPTHIHLAQSYLHGDMGDAPMSGCPSACVATSFPSGSNSLPFAYVGNACIYCSVAYTYFDKNLRPGAEGHGVGLLLVQQFKFVHNWVEGGSIGKICGGAGASISFANFITCQYEEDRGNRYTYPYSWMLAWNGGFCPNTGSCAGNSFVRKNAHEYKFGKYVLEDGNIYENVDNSGAQNGTTFSHKTAQNSGGGAGSNYWTELDNVTVSNIVGRTSCNGPSYGDRSAAVGNGGGVSLPTQLIAFTNVLEYNVSIALAGCAVTGFNSAPQYGLRNGQSVPSATWAATATRDAAGLTSTLTLTSVAGQTISDQAVGDPVTVTGCSDSTFNVGNTVLGPPALAGTLLNGLTVVYSNPGTANATATGCTFSNAQGWPQYLSCNHCTMISDAGHNSPYDSALEGTNIWAFARNITYQNSIFVNGGLSSASGEGTAVSTRDYDPTTLVFNNDFIGGRTAANYTEYGGPNAGASPPVTIYFTPNFCTTTSPAGCLGMLAGMSQSSFPLIPPAVGSFVAGDYHSLRLCKSTDAACGSTASTYAAGGTGQANDGTDLGVNIPAIDAAQTSILYVCLMACGTGPFPDAPSGSQVNPPFLLPPGSTIQ